MACFCCGERASSASLLARRAPRTRRRNGVRRQALREARLPALQHLTEREGRQFGCEDAPGEALATTRATSTLDDPVSSRRSGRCPEVLHLLVPAPQLVDLVEEDEARRTLRERPASDLLDIPAQDAAQRAALRAGLRDRIERRGCRREEPPSEEGPDDLVDAGRLPTCRGPRTTSISPLARRSRDDNSTTSGRR